MNFDNKQFRLGRLCQIVLNERCEFLCDWIYSLNRNLKDFGLLIDNNLLEALLKFYNQENIKIKVGRMIYFVIGNIKKIDNEFISTCENKSGIIHIENNKVMMINRHHLKNEIFRKVFDEGLTEIN